MTAKIMATKTRTNNLPAITIGPLCLGELMPEH
jgi:hypothetical protein